MEAADTAAIMFEPGLLSTIPTLCVFILAIWLKRPIEALVAGSIIGTIMVSGSDFIGAFTETTTRVMHDDDLIWVILVCGFMGAMIALFIRTGAISAFITLASKRIVSKASALFTTWLMGIALFVDDYFNSITLGAAMKGVTDKYKTSREMLAYVIDSTAAPISVIIPISTWGVFFAGMIESNNLSADGAGFATYVQAVPYMLYAWIAVLMVPLVASGKIPAIGPMKAAEARAQAGQPIPDGAEHLVKSAESIKEKEGVKKYASLFILPNILLVAATLYFDLDFLKAVYVTLALTITAILALRLLDHHDTLDHVIDGFKLMIEPLAIIFAAYMLKDVNGQLGLTTYILGIAADIVTAQNLPVIIFATMGLVSFATGSNWGVFVIAMPIIAELTSLTGADTALVIGATLSASTFGSHACFYTDATVLTANSAGCTPMQHAITQLPYSLVAAALSLLGFWVLG